MKTHFGMNTVSFAGNHHKKDHGHHHAAGQNQKAAAPHEHHDKGDTVSLSKKAHAPKKG